MKVVKRVISYIVIAISVIVGVIGGLLFFRRRTQKTTNDHPTTSVSSTEKLVETVDKKIEEKYQDRNITALVDLMNQQLRKRK